MGLSVPPFSPSPRVHRHSDNLMNMMLGKGLKHCPVLASPALWPGLGLGLRRQMETPRWLPPRSPCPLPLVCYHGA